MFEKYDAIIFDLDGTLVDSMWIWKAIDIEFLEKRNIKLPDTLQSEIEGMSFTETASYFKKEFGLEDSIEEIKDEWNKSAFIYYNEKIELKDDVDKVLEYFKNQGKIMGIGTSNSKELAETVIKSKGIEKYFDTLVTSCDVNKGKPNPDVFLKVAEVLNVEPSKCLVFEDTFAGVKAAKAAGMDVIAIYDKIASEMEESIKETATKYILSYNEII